MEELQNNHILYKHGEKNVVIDGKTSDIKELMEIFENQINFYSESIKTVDGVLFGIKSRVEIEKILGM
jgi:hypothetical protein